MREKKRKRNWNLKEELCIVVVVVVNTGGGGNVDIVTKKQMEKTSLDEKW